MSHQKAKYLPLIQQQILYIGRYFASPDLGVALTERC